MDCDRTVPLFEQRTPYGSWDENLEELLRNLKQVSFM
jgi:hypothetical protein